MIVKLMRTIQLHHGQKSRKSGAASMQALGVQALMLRSALVSVIVFPKVVASWEQKWTQMMVAATRLSLQMLVGPPTIARTGSGIGSKAGPIPRNAGVVQTNCYFVL